LALAVMDEPVILRPGVSQALSTSATRHTRFLLTKGEQAEQQRNVAESGLKPYFRKVVIGSEKHIDTGLSLTAVERLEPKRTWMIGNSPRSDVVPALAAGLNAVLVPHPATWCLEDASLPRVSGRFLFVEDLIRLLRYF
jgi:putative hydrolase of the HAD superfamily